MSTQPAPTPARSPADVAPWCWHSVRVQLENRRWHAGARASPLVLLRALALDAGARSGIDVVFSLLGTRAAHLPPRRGERLDVEFRFFGAADTDVRAWCDRLLANAGASTDNNFVAHLLRAPQAESIAAFLDERIDGDEACLWFSTPLAMASKDLRLPFAQFADLLQQRFTRAFGAPAPLPRTELHALDAYWRFDTRLRHRSRTGGGEEYRLQGYSGAYYLRGDVQAWWPWLRLAQATLVGKRVPFGLGSFALSAPGPAALAPRLGNPGLMHAAYEHVVATHDDAVEQLAAAVQAPFDAVEWCTAQGAMLRDGSFVPSASRTFTLTKRDGGARRVERPGWEALIVARHLHDLLAEPLDRGFLPTSLAYRKGHSRDTAAAAVDAAIDAGCRYVVKADVDDFFPSVDLARVEADLAAVLPRADHEVVAAVATLLRTPWCDEHGAVHARERGLAQGSPLSPLLANLHLHAVDAALAGAGIQALRYADDVLLLLCRDASAAEQALQHLRDDLGKLSLGLDAAKTRIHAIDEGFEFLGFRFPRDAQAASAVPLRLPLHIVEPYTFLALHGDAVEIRIGGKPHDLVPLRRIDRILLHAPGAMSTALLQRCADRAQPIPLVFGAGPHGRVLAVESDSAQHYDTAYRQARRYDAMGHAERLAVAKALVDAKIANAASFLRQRYRPGMNEQLARLQRIGADLHAAGSLDALRGHEGAAARIVFARIGAMIEVSAFEFTQRDRDGADRFNPLLNYGYYLLFLRINLELRGLGLNPFLGFLHAGDVGTRYEALTCDVQELFRAYVDRLLVRLVNLRAIDAASMTLVDGRYRLGRDMMRAVALQFERELQRHATGRPLTLAQAITAQCINVRDFLVDGASLYCHRWSGP